MKSRKLPPTLEALANPHRLRIIAALKTEGRDYVSQPARDVGISRPLLHLAKLEAAGLVTSKHVLSSDGKALNYFDVADFCLTLDPTAIVEAARHLNLEEE